MPVLSTDDERYEFTVESADDHNIRILVEDPTTNISSEKQISVSVNRDSII
jgi:hypothetical protein